MPVRRTVLAGVLVLVGCGDDFVEGPLVCDDIGWPLGITPVILPPQPEFEVECADGWGNAVATREALDTVAIPDGTWRSLPHPADGWIHVVIPDLQPRWRSWLDQQGIDPSTYAAAGHFMLRVDEDGDLGWMVPDYSIWAVDVVGEELWALGWDEDLGRWLLVFDSNSGELLDSAGWDLGTDFNWIDSARDPAGGVWMSVYQEHDANELVDQSLYRVTSIHAPDLVAMRTTEDPRQRPFGAIQALMDGGAVWWTSSGFEVIDPDGSVRWTHPDGWATASDADSMLITSRIPTGVGAGQALRLEQVALVDGSNHWTREHQRFVPTDPESCGTEGCALWDSAWPVLRPDGGYLLAGFHSYPSSSCLWQPLIMAVSVDGEAEWAHRVDVCGRAFAVAFREGSKLELLGLTGEAQEASAGAWLRWFEL